MSAPEINQHPLRNNIRYWREYYAVSQRYIARIVGISSTEMSVIERGKVLPNVTTAIRIAKVLGVAATDLWEA